MGRAGRRAGSVSIFALALAALGLGATLSAAAKDHTAARRLASPSPSAKGGSATADQPKAGLTARIGEPITLRGTARAKPGRLRWRVLRAPSGADPHLSRVRTSTPTFRADQPGTYRVAPAGGATAAGADELTVTVTAWRSDLGVPIQTITNDHAIQIGPTKYPQNGNWIHLLVIDPRTGALLPGRWGSGNQAVPIPATDNVPKPEDQDLTHWLSWIKQDAPNALVVMTGQGIPASRTPPQNSMAALDLAFKNLGGTFDAKPPAYRSPVKDAYQLLDGQWSVVGSPGTTLGLGNQNDRMQEAPIPGFAGGDPGLPGSLNGYLEPLGEGLSAKLVFASPEMLPLDTRGPGSSLTQNVITVGPNTKVPQDPGHVETFPSSNIMRGAVAVQLLVLDSGSGGGNLAPLANKTFYLTDPNGLAVQGSPGAPPTPAPKDIGNVNVDAWCKRNHKGSHAVLPGGRYGSGAVYRWKCQQGSTLFDVDFNSACRQQRDPNAFAQFTDQNDAYSWRCYLRPKDGFSPLNAPGIYDLAGELNFWSQRATLQGNDPLLILQTFGGPLPPGGGPMASSYWANDGPPKQPWADVERIGGGDCDGDCVDSPYTLDRNHLDLRPMLSRWEWASFTVAGELGALAGVGAHDAAANFGYAFPPYPLYPSDPIPPEEWGPQQLLGGLTLVTTTHTFLQQENAYFEGPVDPAAARKLGMPVDCQTDLDRKPLCTGGRVRGELVRNDQSQWRLSTPSSTKQIIAGKAQFDFDTRTSRAIAFQDDVPWPCSREQANPCPGTPGQVASANYYIAQKLFGPSVQDVRDKYTDTTFDNSDHVDQLDGLDYPPLSQQPPGMPNFNPATFNAMKSQLRTEFRKVSTVRQGVKTWEQVVSAPGTGSTASIGQITDSVLTAVATGRKEAIAAIKQRQAEIDSTETTSSALHVFSEIAEIAVSSTPGLEEFGFFLPSATGALSGVLELTHSLTPHGEHPEDEVPDDSGAVRTAAANLQASLARQYNDILDTLLHLKDVYVSDWGRLEAASTKFDQLWTFRDRSLPAFRNVQTAAAMAQAYQALLPLAYKEYVVGPYRQDPNNDGVGPLPRDYQCASVTIDGHVSDDTTKPFGQIGSGGQHVVHYRFNDALVPPGVKQPGRFDRANAWRLGFVIKENLPNPVVYDNSEASGDSIWWSKPEYPGGAPLPPNLTGVLFAPVNPALGFSDQTGLGLDRDEFFATSNWTTKRVSCGDQ